MILLKLKNLQKFSGQKDQKIRDDKSTANINDEIKKLMESEEKDNISNNDSRSDSSLEDSIIKILNEN